MGRFFFCSYAINLFTFFSQKKWKDSLLFFQGLSILITLNPGLRLRMYSDVYGETQFSSFIQYPNVTSLFFIISFIVLSYEIIENKKEKYLIQDIIFIIFSVSVLAVGVVWTKSRYGIILFLAVFLFLAISKKELRKIFIPLLGVGAYVYSIL